MLALVSVVAVLQASAPNADVWGPADWGCAEPLIERNYSRPIESRQLALRIADECVRPYEPRPAPSEAEGASPEAAQIFDSLDRTHYGHLLSIFVSEIEGRILRARRREAIPLD